jgi:hypothetical protein
VTALEVFCTLALGLLIIVGIVHLARPVEHTYQPIDVNKPVKFVTWNGVEEFILREMSTTGSSLRTETTLVFVKTYDWGVSNYEAHSTLTDPSEEEQ